jgi:hypothetical protein
VARNSVAPSNNSTALKNVGRLKVFPLFKPSSGIAFVGGSITAGGSRNEWFGSHMTVKGQGH